MKNDYQEFNKREDDGFKLLILEEFQKFRKEMFELFAIKMVERIVFAFVGIALTAIAVAIIGLVVIK